ncbi:MAG: hypothetical protein FGF53_09730 [Candidatus Brockarchaeota archaeon]|nr:hypothetical protein [Candidatus Brockarchaeota archaeon]
MRSLIEKLPAGEVEAEEFLGEEALKVSTELLGALEERRKKGMAPFAILAEKSAVKLVKEGRGR